MGIFRTHSNLPRRSPSGTFVQSPQRTSHSFTSPTYRFQFTCNMSVGSDRAPILPYPTTRQCRLCSNNVGEHGKCTVETHPGTNVMTSAGRFWFKYSKLDYRLDDRRRESVFICEYCTDWVEILLESSVKVAAWFRSNDRLCPRWEFV